MTHTILIIEDDLASLVLYEQMIRKFGWSTLTATDGELALLMLAESAPHAILLDLRLPKVDGVTIIDYICSTPHLETTTICVLTAHPDYEALVHLRPHDLFLRKPVSPAQIGTLLQKIAAGVD